MKAMWIFAIVCTVFFACKKESDPAPAPGGEVRTENEIQAAALDSFLQSNTFKLSRYYSDSAIDYNDTDQVVKAETELWSYVSAWLKDDLYTFGTDGQVTIEQNAVKIPADSTAILHRPYSVEADDTGVLLKFMGHEYQPLDYRLIEFSDTLLRVSAKWNGKTVKSDYSVVQ